MLIDESQISIARAWGKPSSLSSDQFSYITDEDARAIDSDIDSDIDSEFGDAGEECEITGCRNDLFANPQDHQVLYPRTFPTLFAEAVDTHTGLDSAVKAMPRRRSPRAGPQWELYRGADADWVEIHLEQGANKHRQHLVPLSRARWVHDLDDEEEYAKVCELNERKQDLARFYAQYQPAKIPDVHSLLTSYKFDDVKASLLKKYKALPEGWEPPRSCSTSLHGMKAELRHFVSALCTGNIIIED